MHDGTLVESDFSKHYNKDEVISRHSRKERWKITSETDTSTPKPLAYRTMGQSGNTETTKGKEISLRKPPRTFGQKGLNDHNQARNIYKRNPGAVGEEQNKVTPA